MKALLLVLLIIPFASALAQVKPRVGLVIKKTSKIAKGEYRLSVTDPKHAITIEGDNITVDFQGATLRGTPANTRPDQRKGTAIWVSGKNVTIKNVNIHGFKNGIVAWNCPGLKILSSDLSYNWKQHLGSTLEREDLSDWMSYHHNDDDEWLKGNPKEGTPGYGGAMYLRGCDGFEVKNVTVTGGQNALMITRSNKGKVWNNNFSFNSSLGIGMYRSSENVVMHNKVDWNVRGYSHGVYNRGQDSAGILVYEQSNKNLFAYNSVTHGGDGFFLWAGQSTMDSGQGGCNDNLLYGNDFSHAPTNGIEATFSRNKFVNNLVEECWHGVWGGYSYDSLILGNFFGKSDQSIAIEHGQNNTIRGNLFRDVNPIVLWMNKTQDPNWGYPKNRNTKSHGYKIDSNMILSAQIGLNVRDTTEVVVTGNEIYNTNVFFKREGDTTGWIFTRNTILGGGSIEKDGEAMEEEEEELKEEGNKFEEAGSIVVPTWQPSYSSWSRVRATSELPSRAEVKTYEPKPLAGGNWPFIDSDASRGRAYILVDEWGPYDFKSPILWPRGEVEDFQHGKVQKVSILGPPGTWRAVKISGVEWHSADSGTVPGSLLIRPRSGQAADVVIDLEYVGRAVVSPWGVKTPAGKPSRFSYRRFFAPIAWNVKWFAWDDSNDPRTKADAFKSLISGKPIKEEQTGKLEYSWYGAIGKDLPSDHFATVAEGEFTIAPGNYVLHLTTDDGARVWVDDKLVIADAWKYQGPTPYQAKLKLGGNHKIRVEHFEIDGFSTLQVRLDKK